MEKDFGSSFRHQYSGLHFARLNFSYPQFDIRQQNFMIPQSYDIPPNGNSPFFEFSGLPESKASQKTEPRRCLYSSPQFYQGFTPEKLAPRAFEKNLGGDSVGTESAPKKFLVFDQIGGQTTLIYSSATPSNLKPDALIERNETSPFGCVYGDECYDENNGDGVESEMHEDTEELNALLYSDDENDSSDGDEETSTGHSPSTMTGNSEEIASSSGPTKRPKLLHGSYDAPSLRDTATSAKSSCGKKRLRKDKIRETISILQDIIPEGKGKDSMVVIDEAIRYLKSLKVKAKSLGLDSI